MDSKTNDDTITKGLLCAYIRYVFDECARVRTHVHTHTHTIKKRGGWLVVLGSDVDPGPSWMKPWPCKFETTWSPTTPRNRARVLLSHWVSLLAQCAERLGLTFSCYQRQPGSGLPSQQCYHRGFCQRPDGVRVKLSNGVATVLART